MAKDHPRFWKRVAIGFGVVLIVLALSILSPAGSGFSSVRAREIRSLEEARQLAFACRVYAEDNGGRFPPSLDALIPAYLLDRAQLVSPLDPRDVVGYAYAPGLTESSPPKTIVIEDKFSPAAVHIRIVGYVDGSGDILKVPEPEETWSERILRLVRSL